MDIVRAVVDGPAVTVKAGDTVVCGDEDHSRSRYQVRREGDYWVVRDPEYRLTFWGWKTGEVAITAPSFRSAWEGLDRLIWERALQRAKTALHDRPDLVRELSR